MQGPGRAVESRSPGGVVQPQSTSTTTLLQLAASVRASGIRKFSGQDAVRPFQSAFISPALATNVRTPRRACPTRAMPDTC